MDKKSCHSQEDKHSNIILNKDVDASNQQVYIEIHGSDCMCTGMPDDTRTFYVLLYVTLCPF